jgi:hypothetical protein
MRAGRSRPPTAIATRRRRAGRNAWLAALTMTVLAVTPLLALFHQISAPHSVCEHGELVESSDSHFSSEDWVGVVDPAANQGQTAPASEIRPDSDSALHGHSHCSVGTLAKNSVALLLVTQVVTAMREASIGGQHDAAFPYLQTILFNAPKTSPPRV